jgi:glycosyl-4,4'-diaponeurosporenoate acyltransferase
MRLIKPSTPVAVALNFVAWGIFHSLAGYLAWRTNERRFLEDNCFTRLRVWEQDGQFYTDRLLVRRWKNVLPEAGGLLPGGFSKKRLERRDDEYLHAFLCETRRAEFSHWLAMAPAPLFFLWNKWPAAALMIPYAVLVNLPFIAVQRYNRARLERVLAVRERERLAGRGAARQEPS